MKRRNNMYGKRTHTCPSQPKKPTIAALVTLIILQLLMLMALFTQTVPHPPLAVAPFAIAPFLAVSLAACTAPLILGTGTRAGTNLSVLAALLALISFGPQKYIDPQFPLIWPAVLTGQFAAAIIVIDAIKKFRATRAAT